MHWFISLMADNKLMIFVFSYNMEIELCKLLSDHITDQIIYLNFWRRSLIERYETNSLQLLLCSSLPTITHINNIPTNTQSKSNTLSLTECVWEFGNHALLDTHKSAGFCFINRSKLIRYVDITATCGLQSSWPHF